MHIRTFDFRTIPHALHLHEWLVFQSILVPPLNCIFVQSRRKHMLTRRSWWNRHLGLIQKENSAGKRIKWLRSSKTLNLCHEIQCQTGIRHSSKGITGNKQLPIERRNYHWELQLEHSHKGNVLHLLITAAKKNEAGIILPEVSGADFAPGAVTASLHPVILRYCSHGFLAMISLRVQNLLLVPSNCGILGIIGCRSVGLSL